MTTVFRFSSLQSPEDEKHLRQKVLQKSCDRTAWKWITLWGTPTKGYPWMGIENQESKYFSSTILHQGSSSGKGLVMGGNSLILMVVTSRKKQLDWWTSTSC